MVWVFVVVFLICGIGNVVGMFSDDFIVMMSVWLLWFLLFGWVE